MVTPRTIGEVPGSSGSVDSRRSAGDRLNGVRVKCSAKIFVMAMPIATLTQASRSYISRMLRDGVLMLLVGVWLGTVAAHAQNATWLLNPVSGNFDAAANWSPTTVPTGTATFEASNTTAITFSSPTTTVGILQFSVGAPAYSLNLSGSNTLTISGTGIVNNSSNAPTISNNSGGGTLFLGTSTAGNAIIINHADSGGFTEFANSSTAGNATITATGSGTGATFFTDTSSAGNATVIATSGGFTEFNGSSTAGSATVNTDPRVNGFRKPEHRWQRDH